MYQCSLARRETHHSHLPMETSHIVGKSSHWTQKKKTLFKKKVLKRQIQNMHQRRAQAARQKTASGWSGDCPVSERSFEKSTSAADTTACDTLRNASLPMALVQTVAASTQGEPTEVDSSGHESLSLVKAKPLRCRKHARRESCSPDLPTVAPASEANWWELGHGKLVF